MSTPRRSGRRGQPRAQRSHRGGASCENGALVAVVFARRSVLPRDLARRTVCPRAVPPRPRAVGRSRHLSTTRLTTTGPPKPWERFQTPVVADLVVDNSMLTLVTGQSVNPARAGGAPGSHSSSRYTHGRHPFKLRAERVSEQMYENITRYINAFDGWATSGNPVVSSRGSFVTSTRSPTTATQTRSRATASSGPRRA